MADHDVFVSTERPADDVRAVIEAELGAAFSARDGADPGSALATGTTKLFFHDSHPFEGDHNFPVTRYQYWISVHDSARNEERQLAIAHCVFDAIKAQGWPTMLSFNLQGNISIYP